MNPILRMLFGPASMATIGDGRPGNSASDMDALTKAYAAARARKHGGSFAQGGDPMMASATLPPPPAPSAPFPQGTDPMTAGMPQGVPMPPPRPPQAPQPAPSVPMPMARPPEAPQPAPDTGFFMRNALMQQDPMGGGFINPTGAQSVRGPDLISKMMTYLHNKEMG